MIDVPHVMPVAVTVFTLSVGAWQCSSAPSGAAIVLGALIISMLIVLQKTALSVTFWAPKCIITI